MLPNYVSRCKGIKRVDSTYDNQVVCPKRRTCQRWLELINASGSTFVADYMCEPDFKNFIPVTFSENEKLED